jgi:hypothetical protein
MYMEGLLGERPEERRKERVEGKFNEPNSELAKMIAGVKSIYIDREEMDYMAAQEKGLLTPLESALGRLLKPGKDYFVISGSSIPCFNTKKMLGELGFKKEHIGYEVWD